MKALAIIPARGGSKRLPKKNLRKLGNKPLVTYALDAAEESGCFDNIILSSDDNDVLVLAKNYKSVEALKRPEYLSGDHVTALNLVLEIITDAGLKTSYDVVALLLPTAPFRNKEHIRKGFSLLDKNCDGVVSLTEYEFPPQLSVYLQKGFIEPVFEPCPLITGDTRSQDQKPIYRPNGAFYIQWMEKFLINQNFWKGKIRGYVMNRLNSVDIDDINDLNYAKFLLDQNKNSENS